MIPAARSASGSGTNPRRTALEAFAKARGTAVTDPNTQADFLVDELTNKNAATYQPGVFAKMQGAQTAADATRVWTSTVRAAEKGQFRRPHRRRRKRRGSLDDNGNFVLGKGAPATCRDDVLRLALRSQQRRQRRRRISRGGTKLTSPPTDAEGKPVAGAKSPLQELTQASISRLGSEGQTEKHEAAGGKRAFDSKAQARATSRLAWRTSPRSTGRR